MISVQVPRVIEREFGMSVRARRGSDRGWGDEHRWRNQDGG
jgi:hypothetical protein